jgi:hypothetical protein
MQTGLVRQSYLAGTTTFSTHAESAAIGGELSMTIQSNANASAKWFQKLGQQQFVKLSWTDGTYSATVNTSIIVTEVTPIAGNEDGLTTMTVTGRLAYDPTSASSIKIVVENSISALP